MRQIFEDGEGHLSSYRVVMVLFFAVFSLAWTVISIKSWALQDIPAGVIAVAGMVLAGKQVQTKLGG